MPFDIEVDILSRVHVVARILILKVIVQAVEPFLRLMVHLKGGLAAQGIIGCAHHERACGYV